jgi:DNA mismatch endonuclease (patch repair protein)
MDAARQSMLMAHVRSKDTQPELRLRRRLHGAGFRFRLHRRDLPGTPDVVLPGLRVAIFVHGCYWHRHPGCPKSTVPSRNLEYWLPKFQRTLARDRQAEARLIAAGWRVRVVWECELGGQQTEKLLQELRATRELLRRRR